MTEAHQLIAIAGSFPEGTFLHQSTSLKLKPSCTGCSSQQTITGKSPEKV